MTFKTKQQEADELRAQIESWMAQGNLPQLITNTPSASPIAPEPKKKGRTRMQRLAYSINADRSLPNPPKE